MLSFKNPPDYEDPKDAEHDADGNGTIDAASGDDPAEGAANNDYEVTVRATEVRAADAEGATMATNQDITVTVTNVDEPGSVDLSRLQPQTGQPITATLNDPDGPAGAADVIDPAWEWSVPKVSRPVIDNDNHWALAVGATDDTAADGSSIYTPPAGVGNNEDKVLRAKATYTDAASGDQKKAFKVSYHPVREAVTPEENKPA